MQDLIIIGAGPAGLSASIYASRYGLKNTVVGALAGGLASTTHEIGNWLGTEKINGFDFSQKMLSHAKSYQPQIIERMVKKIEKNDTGFIVTVSNDEQLTGKTILFATGTNHRHLGIPGEAEFAGKGVSYCATCDGFFYRGKTVAVIGGNDSAATAAVYLGDIAEKVYLIYRKDKLKAEDFWQQAIAKNPKIEIIYNTIATEIKGAEKIKSITTNNNGLIKDLEIDGLFIEIGSEPNTSLISSLKVETDNDGYIIIKPDGATNIPGIWAAGDITTGSNKFKQIITAAAEGAIAAASIQQQLKR